MKKSLWLIPVILVGLLTAAAEVVERVLAKVNDDIITLSELNRTMESYRRDLEAKFTGQQLEEKIAEMESQLLDRLIVDKLIKQKAVELGYDANVDADVSSEVQRIMKENNIPDTETLDQALAQQGMTLRELREQISDAIMSRYLVNDFVGSRITLLTPEIEKYYKDHAADFTTAEEVTLSEIVLPAEGSAGEAENRANDIYRRLQQGEAFSALASQYSKGPTANKGGNIGTYVVSKLRSDMVSAIKGLEAGDISEPQKTAEGFVIYHIDSRKPAAVQPLEEVRNEIRNRLWDQKFNPEYDRFVSQLKEDAYIEIYSEAQGLN